MLIGGTPPKYVVIINALQQRINNGTYPPGGRLPSESDLIREFGASRPVVVRALDLLRQDGWIESRQGKGRFALSRPGGTGQKPRSRRTGLRGDGERGGREAMSDRVTVERPNDEAVHVYVDGDYVAGANYTERGWSGMKAVEQAALAVAGALTAAVPQGGMKTVIRVVGRGSDVTWEGVLPVLAEGSAVTLPDVGAVRVVSSMINIDAGGFAEQDLSCQ